jgi:molecular chaperone DnaJ
MKKHYDTLEISENATPEEVHDSYRRLAKKYHPDKGSKTADKFKEITEAYEALKSNKSNQLQNIKPARVRRGSDISVSLKVTQNEIVSETSRTIITTRATLCPSCHGSGSSKPMLKCSKCNGSGIDVLSSVVGPRKFCSYCKGYGDVSQGNDCKKCGGIGILKERIQRTIKLSRENQNRIVIKESGNYAPGGGNPGDLIVSLYSDTISLFEISGKNIKGIISITPAQAVLGDIIFMDVFGNAVKITIPPGTKPETELEQHNVPIGTRKGTLFLKVSIEIPTKPTEEEKSLYKQLLKIQKGFL